MKAHVSSGIDRIDTVAHLLEGKRVGLMTNPTGIDHNFNSSIDVIAKRFNLTAYSIFNIERTAPTEEMMQDVDALVFDIRGAGTRFFEYIHCLGSIMKACAAYGKPVVVLDRIAPLGGEVVEGTICPPDMHTIVGDYELPSRFALTMGEFAVRGVLHL